MPSTLAAPVLLFGPLLPALLLLPALAHSCS